MRLMCVTKPLVVLTLWAIGASAIPAAPPTTEAPSAPATPKTEAPKTEKPAEKKDKFDPARWTKDMEGFDAADKRSPPSPGGTVFTGSSSIRMWDLKASFPGRPFMNRGFGGSVYRDVTAWLDQTVVRYAPGRVVLYSGDNDVAAGLSPEQIEADAAKLLDAIHAKLPETKVIIISIKPSPKRAALGEKAKDANKRLAKLATERDYAKFVDIWDAMLGPKGEYRPELYKDDQLHMTPAGYKIWSDALEAHF